jgi:fructose-bisphosphate aldolase, class I
MDIDQLESIAQQLVAPAKGILAADESGPTIQKRFDSIGVDSTEESRRDYRELLFRANGASDYISGVILYDETLRQKAADGTPLVDVLRDQGIIPGIKVDNSTRPLAGAPGELITEGLDGLRDRLAEYFKLGARFAKWRAVITIGEGIPSDRCISANAHALARYAALCQEAGLVPMVEPEVLIDGDHDIAKCFEVTEATLRETYAQLAAQRVVLEGTLLKPSMVLSGKSAANRADSSEVGERSVECYMATVPDAVPGLVFLSGGQGDEEATENLNAINRQGAKVGAPWELSFSFGRGLQAAPLSAWGGDAANVDGAKDAFIARARASSMARQGKYASAT